MNRVTIGRVKRIDHRTVRMDDVARAAGLSRTTVSLVLSGKAGPNIPEVTRQRVRAAAAELGYVPNALASGFRRNTSDSIGLVSDVVATTPFSVRMLRGAQEVAWAAGKLLMVVNTENDPDLERAAITQLLERRVDGILYATLAYAVVDPPPALEAVPTVLMDARARDVSLPSVVPDDHAGGRAATQHLVDAGHRRIGYISDPGGPAATERLEGYLEVLREAGVEPDPALIAGGPGDAAGGVTAAGVLLDLAEPPTAIFCFNDRMAMGAYRAARHRGLSIPGDLSIVGYDNHDVIAPWLDPPLTTVELPHLEMGRWATRHLLDLLDGTIPAGAPPTQHRMHCPLIVRDSVAPPRR